MNNTTVTGKVLRLLKPYRLLIVLILLLSCTSVLFTLYVPILLGRAIDLIIGPGRVRFAEILPILMKSGFFAASAALLQWLLSALNNRITFDVVRDLRSRAFAHIQHLPLSYLDSHPSGETVSRVITDTDQFADGLLLGFTQLFTGVVTILGTLVFMFSVHPVIMLVVVVLTPLSLLIAAFIAKRTYSMFRAQSELRGRQTSFINEMIGNQKVVQAFSHEQKSLEEFDSINDELETCSLKATFFSSITNPSTRFVNNLVYACVGLAGALAVLGNGFPGGALTVGGLTCFLSYANQYMKPFNEISGVIAELQNALACASRLFALLEEPSEAPDLPAVSHPKKLEGNLIMEHVSFSYTPNKPLLQDLNISVRPGQKVAIVGPTGCGKTTLINLIMRFYDVNEGRILLEGADIRSLPRRTLRSNIDMVLQETWLKNDTVRENIRFGAPDASDEEVIRAAKASKAHTFIMQLPNGYDTVIREEDGTLSQGQKQLLCIARVMLHQPPMLILDEATSSIDTRTEKQVQEAFSALMKGRTSFIVAHRLSTVKDADLILVMKDGNIIEQGNHEELLRKNGFYRSLYNSQFAPVQQKETPI